MTAVIITAHGVEFVIADYPSRNSPGLTHGELRILMDAARGEPLAPAMVLAIHATKRVFPGSRIERTINQIDCITPTPRNAERGGKPQTQGMSAVKGDRRESPAPREVNPGTGSGTTPLVSPAPVSVRNKQRGGGEKQK